MAFVLASHTARADDGGADGVRIEYVVEDGCPDEATFVEHVRTRAPRFRRSANVGSLGWIVTAGQVANGVRTGQLAVRAPGGASSVREVRGDTCAEVVSALALVAALTIDPTAGAEPTSPPANPGPSPAAANAADRSSEAAAAPPRRHGGVQIGGGANAEVHGGSSPETAPGVVVFVEGRTRRAGLFAPALRAAFARSFASSATLAGRGSAELVLTAAWIDLCPSRWAADAFSASACARGEIGALHGKGRDITPAREDAPIWLAAAGIVRGEVAVAGPLSLEVSGGVRVPLLRSRYVLQPDATVFRVPAVGWIAAAGIALRFP